jgi:hypothetical protein
MFVVGICWFFGNFLMSEMPSALCWIDLSTNGPNGPLGLWLASGSGTPSPLEGWWAPVAQHYKREWGPRARKNEVRRRHCSPLLQTLTDLEGTCWSDGKLHQSPPSSSTPPPSRPRHGWLTRRTKVWFTQCIHPLDLLLVDPAIYHPSGPASCMLVAAGCDFQRYCEYLKFAHECRISSTHCCSVV